MGGLVAASHPTGSVAWTEASGPSLCVTWCSRACGCLLFRLLLLDTRISEDPSALCLYTGQAHSMMCQTPKPSHSTSGGATRVVRDQKPRGRAGRRSASPRGWTSSHRVPGNVSARKKTTRTCCPSHQLHPTHTAWEGQGLQPHILPSRVTCWAVIEHHVFFFFLLNLSPAILKNALSIMTGYIHI